MYGGSDAWITISLILRQVKSGYYCITILHTIYYVSILLCILSFSLLTLDFYDGNRT